MRAIILDIDEMRRELPLSNFPPAHWYVDNRRGLSWCGEIDGSAVISGCLGRKNWGDGGPQICDTVGMRFIAALLGRLMFCLGLMITVVGCVIGSMLGSTGGTSMSGMILMILGAGIYWFGATKVCPQCSKRIKHNERACRHCGAAPG